MTNKLITLGKELSRFVVGAEGNVSQRSGNGFMIKASGKSLNNMDYNSIVRCDPGGNIQDGPIRCDNRPSIETDFHAWIYANSDYSFIAHTHPVNTLKILCSDAIYSFAEERLFPDHVVFNGLISCVVPYATPGIELMKAIEKSTSEFKKHNKVFPNLFLLKNHGIICCTNSPQEAIVMTEICEKAADIFLGAALAGDTCFLTKQEIEDIEQHKGEAHRKKLL